jgi:cell division ATPase FtsA
VCENIKQAINKAEIDSKIKVNEYMINIPTPNLFFESNKIEIERKTEKEIDESEMYNILKNIETKAFRDDYRKIKEMT